MSGRLRIDVFLDFICPWCLIGKRQLERAQALLLGKYPEVEFTTVWHGVQLLPHLPAQGVPFAEFYRQRLGSADSVRMRQAQVQQAAQAVGETIDFSRIATMPNTADAHRLLERVSVLGNSRQHDALIERLFAAYFHLGDDLGCRETLLSIAQSCGFEAGFVDDCLLGNGEPFVGDPGATGGVPCFQFDRRVTVVGAHPAEDLFGVMQEALLERSGERQPS
ncbi:TPA: DsbA family protein [Pseudomonas putida]|nr:DsbA family protein [Pseudomonas putida]